MTPLSTNQKQTDIAQAANSGKTCGEDTNREHKSTEAHDKNRWPSKRHRERWARIKGGKTDKERRWKVKHKIPVLVTTNTARDVPTYHLKYMVSLDTDVAVNCREVSLNMLKQSLKLLWLACQPFPACNSNTFPSTPQYESHTGHTDWPAWTGFQTICDDTNHARRPAS